MDPSHLQEKSRKLTFFKSILNHKMNWLEFHKDLFSSLLLMSTHCEIHLRNHLPLKRDTKSNYFDSITPKLDSKFNNRQITTFLLIQFT